MLHEGFLVIFSFLNVFNLIYVYTIFVEMKKCNKKISNIKKNSNI